MGWVFVPSLIETWPTDKLRIFECNAMIHGTAQVGKIAASEAILARTFTCILVVDGGLSDVPLAKDFKLSLLGIVDEKLDAFLLGPVVLKRDVPMESKKESEIRAFRSMSADFWLH